MFACVFLVHPSGFEPETVRVGGENSIQLNYGCIGIPFVITNYFCGNKSVFAVLNSHQCTVEYYFGRLPCKNRTASGDFLSAKMHSTEKSVFLDDFLQTR